MRSIDSSKQQLTRESVRTCAPFRCGQLIKLYFLFVGFVVRTTEKLRIVRPFKLCGALALFIHSGVRARTGFGTSIKAKRPNPVSGPIHTHRNTERTRSCRVADGRNSLKTVAAVVMACKRAKNAQKLHKGARRHHHHNQTHTTTHTH